MVSQAWSCKLNDKRRRGNPLYKHAATSEMKALDFKAQMLMDGSRCPAERVCHPIAVPIDTSVLESEEKADEDGDGEDVAAEFAEVFQDPGAAGEIAIGVTEHLGWKCSYRSQTPELKSFRSWRKRWASARAKWQSTGVRLLAPQIRRSKEQQLSIQQAWRMRRRHSAKAAAAVVGT